MGIYSITLAESLMSNGTFSPSHTLIDSIHPDDGTATATLSFLSHADEYGSAMASCIDHPVFEGYFEADLPPGLLHELPRRGGGGGQHGAPVSAAGGATQAEQVVSASFDTPLNEKWIQRCANIQCGQLALLVLCYAEDTEYVVLLCEDCLNTPASVWAKVTLGVDKKNIVHKIGDAWYVDSGRLFRQVNGVLAVQ